ncbi:MAG TPA: CBS domain-containing protein [Polyangiaceae bacterium]|nr:CBS domain-containing protein [Polyangiaceae bacterium]
MALTCVRLRLPQLGALRATTFVLCPNTGEWKSLRECPECKDLVAEDGLHVVCWQDALGSAKRISELVEPSLVCVEAHENVSDVESLLGAVPDASLAVIVDRGRPVGVIPREALADSQLGGLARDVMRPSLVSMLESASADDALSALAGDIDHIVVMGAGRVVGVVTSASASMWAARQAHAAGKV